MNINISYSKKKKLIKKTPLEFLKFHLETEMKRRKKNSQKIMSSAE